MKHPRRRSEHGMIMLLMILLVISCVLGIWPLAVLFGAMISVRYFT